MKWFTIIMATMMLLPCGYRIEHCTVTDVSKGIVTMTGEDGDYWIPEDEAWKVGNKALALVSKGKIIEVRYLWRKR